MYVCILHIIHCNAIYYILYSMADAETVKLIYRIFLHPITHTHTKAKPKVENEKNVQYICIRYIKL